jgi:hypothetical protein
MITAFPAAGLTTRQAVLTVCLVVAVSALVAVLAFGVDMAQAAPARSPSGGGPT